jgi:two-component system, OmpR family, sensor kinase
MASGIETWLALSCSRDGTIERVLRDDFGFAKPGVPLADVVDSGSSAKATAFIATLVEKTCAIGWVMNVPAGEIARPIAFGGAAAGESLIIMARPATDVGMDNALYDELSRLNNDIINRERELARKNAALERLSAEKSRVVAIAAHDLRNPLTVIASYADLLKITAELTDEPAQYLEEISRSARFMIELVEELLDTSRVESGHVELDLQELDLVKAAGHAMVINTMRAERKEIAMAFEPLTDSAVVRADPVKLRQIINNLVVNAIKFSPSRTTVTIRVKRDEASASLEVEDQGIGIPQEKLGAIFEPFRTLGLTGTAGERSVGLGLSIVKQLADLHGAKVQVESEMGKGSLFRVAFPVTPPDAEPRSRRA